MPIWPQIRTTITRLALLVAMPLLFIMYVITHSGSTFRSQSPTLDDRRISAAQGVSARGLRTPEPAFTAADLAATTATQEEPRSKEAGAKTPPTATTTPGMRSAMPATPTAVAPTATPVPQPPTPTPTATEIPRPVLPFTYTVQAGDTLWDLAIKFGINVDSIVWANERLEEDRDSLQIGQVLVIPPVVGALHIVAPGDTLSEIAAFYKVPIEAITGYTANHVSVDDTLKVGQMLVIPGGTKPLLTRWVSTDKGEIAVNVAANKGRFSYPASGMITQYFSRSHLAIDIANKAGSPVLAADGGTVIFAGDKPGGFGLTVIIDHGDGYRTLYAHFQSISVEVGANVQRGQQLGEMGCTGLCTGPHVHFSVYYQGGAVNPLNYLP